MSDVINVPVLEEKDEKFIGFIPTEKERDVISSVFYKFRLTADERNRNYEYFDGLNLIEYIEDSVKRFVTNLDEREGLEDWQARIHDPFTRNKVLAVLGKIVQVLPIAQMIGRGEEDMRRAQILSNLYEYAEESDDYEELMIHMLLETIVKGTAIGYEGLERKEKKIKNVKKQDDKLFYSEKKEITSKLFGAIVPLEDFYPSSVSIRNVKSMPFCFWRSIVPFSKFRMDWGMYAKAADVQPHTPNLNTDGQRPYYQDFISSDVPEGSVEIIRYYNKDVDEYVVIANGVWINPIEMEKGKEISPLPFNHKELPFWDIRYDFFGSDFFYGKSLPDRLKSLQDVLNVLTNMLLDQSFLTIFPPLLTNGFDSIEDDYLRPGRRTPIDTQGLPINQAFMKLDLGTPTGWHQFILDYTRKTMEQSSMDQVSQGVAGVGGRTTAQEIRVAAEGVSALLGIFARLVGYGIKRKAYLKSANIMQFWTDENTPYIEKILGEDGAKEMKDAFNVFTIGNTTLTSGKRGTKVIEMYADKEKSPSKETLQARAEIAKAENDREIEIVAITPEYIREFKYDIKLVPNPKNEASKDIEKAIQLEKVRVYLSFFPDIVDIKELAAQTAEKMGDDPAKILRAEVLNPQVPQEGNMEMDPGMSTKPQGTMANNTVRGMKGGEQQANDLRDIQVKLLGNI